MTADFQVTIHNRNISTLWDTGATKSVISEKCLQKIHCTDKVHPSTGIRLFFTSGSNISPIGILRLSIDLGTHTFKQNSIVCRNLKRWETYCLHQNTKVSCQNIHNRIPRNSAAHYHDK